jgi:uncharacterized protein DUF6510
MMELDGNALAGDLREIFAFDATVALFTCAGCGHGDAIATLGLYGGEMGRVGRCPRCDDVVLTIVRAPDRLVVDLRGAARLELPLSGA